MNDIVMPTDILPYITNDYIFITDDYITVILPERLYDICNSDTTMNIILQFIGNYFNVTVDTKLSNVKLHFDQNIEATNTLLNVKYSTDITLDELNRRLS